MSIPTPMPLHTPNLRSTTPNLCHLYASSASLVLSCCVVSQSLCFSGSSRVNGPNVRSKLRENLLCLGIVQSMDWVSKGTFDQYYLATSRLSNVSRGSIESDTGDSR